MKEVIWGDGNGVLAWGRDIDCGCRDGGGKDGGGPGFTQNPEKEEKKQQKYCKN